MFDRVSNTLLGETTSDHYFIEYKRMRLTWHVAIIQEDIDVIHARKVSRRGARCTYSIIQLTFLENHLTFWDVKKSWIIPIIPLPRQRNIKKIFTHKQASRRRHSFRMTSLHYESYRDIHMIVSANDLTPAANIIVWF